MFCNLRIKFLLLALVTPWSRWREPGLCLEGQPEMKLPDNWALTMSCMLSRELGNSYNGFLRQLRETFPCKEPTTQPVRSLKDECLSLEESMTQISNTMTAIYSKLEIRWSGFSRLIKARAEFPKTSSLK